MGTLWARVDVRGNVAPKIRKAGKWAWQAYEALTRIAKELNDGGFVPDERAEGFEIGFWCNLPDEADELEAARDKLVKVGAIVREPGGFSFPDWKAQQEPDNTNAARQKRYRERKKREREATRDATLQPVTTRDNASATGDAPATRDETYTRNGHQTTPTPNPTLPSASRSRARGPAVSQVTHPGEVMMEAWEAASNPVFVEYGERLLAKFNELTGKSYEFKNTRVHTMAYTIARFCSSDGETVDDVKVRAMGRMLRMVADPEWRRSRHRSKRDWATFSRVFGAPEKTGELLQDAITWGQEVGVSPADPNAFGGAPLDDEELDRLAAEAAQTHHRTGEGGT